MEELIEKIEETLPEGYWFNQKECVDGEWLYVDLPRKSDVLFLTRYALKSSEKAMWEERLNEEGAPLTVSFWPFFCLGSKRNVLRHDKCKFPYSNWLGDAIGLVAPKAVVIITYKGRDNTFKPEWPECAISYKQAFLDSSDSWVQDLRADLEWRFHIGAETLPGDAGTVNAFSVMLKARNGPPTAAKPVTSTVKTVTGGN
jgi:hypothetical protein